MVHRPCRRLHSRAILWSALVISVMASLATASARAAEPPRIEGTVEKVACPFEVGKALLAVDCGRLKVPESYDQPGRTIEVAYMVVRAAPNRDPEHPVLFLSGGPGSPSLVHVETL